MKFKYNHNKFYVLLFCFLILCSCFPIFIKMSYASIPSGSITYNISSDTITIIGANNTHPAEFLDLYNADVAGGWGQVRMLSSNQFLFDCLIVFGDGSTATYFVDTKKQVVFVDGLVSTWSTLISVTANANFTLGVLVDVGNKVTKDGCMIISLDTDTSHELIIGTWGAGGTIYLYDSKFISVSASTWIGCIGSSLVFRAWNCQFDNVGLYSLKSTSDVYNVNICNINQAIYSSVGYMDRVNLYSNNMVYFDQAGGSVISNIFGRNNSYVFMCWDIDDDQFLINADFDVWLTSFGGTSIAEVYRQNEFDLFVLNGEVTDFVEDANVTLWHNGVIYGSWLANSSGQIPTQILTYGFYNQTGGNTMYGGTAWTLSITHPDWSNYISYFYPQEKLKLSVSLQDKIIVDINTMSYDDAFNMTIVAILLSAFIIVSFLILIYKRKK